MSEAEQDFVQHKIRRAVGANAMRRIADIVAEERREDEQKAGILRCFTRYGWLTALAVVLIYAYWAGVI